MSSCVHNWIWNPGRNSLSHFSFAANRTCNITDYFNTVIIFSVINTKKKKKNFKPSKFP